MKCARTVAFALLLAVVLCSLESCGGSATQPTQAVCFGVSGFNVSVLHMWRSGSVYSANVQGLISFTETTSSGGETHTLNWTNIHNDYTLFTVTSFNVTIDGTAYSYPANRCS